MHDVIIIGGGISGMTAAYRLRKNGHKVLVLEEEKEAGGNIRTLSANGARLETGPNSFMGSSEFTWKLIEELNIQDKVMPANPSSKNRYIFRHEKLTPMPMSMSSFISTSLLSWPAKFRLMLEPFIPNGAQEDDTAWQFFCRRFGKEAATYIMSPFVSGVYAGDVKQLGARAAFSKFWNFEKDSGSMIIGAYKYMKNKKRRLKAEGTQRRKGLFSFQGGLGYITQALANNLDKDLVTGVKVESVHKANNGFTVKSADASWRAKSIIAAAPPPAAAAVLKSMIPDKTENIRNIPMSPVAVIHWRAEEKGQNFPDGFGFLMPRLFDYRVLGTLFPSRLFPDRIEKGYQLFTSFYGGMTDPEAADLSDTKLAALLLAEHRSLFSSRLDSARILSILRYPEAIPQLLPDHPEKISRFQTALNREAPGIFLAGNYLTGVGIEHAVESGYASSDKTLKFLSRNKEK